MTLKELCEKYDLSEVTIKSNFNRVRQRIKKETGVTIEKEGRGENACYIEIFPEGRALTMYEEVGKESFVIDRRSISYENVEFYCFLAIVLTQFMVFRGTYIDLIKYMGLNLNNKNIKAVELAMTTLAERGIISLHFDKSTTEGYFTASLLRKAESEMKIGINMVKTCKEIADRYNKRDYIPLLKTWLAMQVASEEQPFTMIMLEKLTGLSSYQVRESKKLLEENELFKTTRAYTSSMKCLGQTVDLNGFYN